MACTVRCQMISEPGAGRDAVGEISRRSHGQEGHRPVSVALGRAWGRGHAAGRWSRAVVRTMIALPVSLAMLAASAAAQQPGAAPGAAPKPRAPQAIEIRGQVPTPQVVTVRPRQTPEFSREVLTPAFYDRQFWEPLVAPYLIGPDLTGISGRSPTSGGSPPLPADSSQRHSAAAPNGQSDVAPAASSSSPASPTRGLAGTAAQGPPSNAPLER